MNTTISEAHDVRAGSISQELCVDSQESDLPFVGGITFESWRCKRKTSAFLHRTRVRDGFP